MSKTENNPLLCDPQNGFCEIPANPKAAPKENAPAKEKPIRIIYFTDPICSACWGIEPQLRKMKLEYDDLIEIDYHMGGLLPDWSYNDGTINGPASVAQHWEEASQYYQMPIDGGVWLEDPLNSSYPPSIAFKAAQIQDKSKAICFLRIIREMLFLEKKNITRWEYITDAANKSGLDIIQMKQNYDNQAKTLFLNDLKLARESGVRGFPTLFFISKSGHADCIYGFRPYSTFENLILKICPKAKKTVYSKDWRNLFEKYPTLTTREFAELTEISIQESEQKLERLIQENAINKFATKNGMLWIAKNGK